MTDALLYPGARLRFPEESIRKVSRHAIANLLTGETMADERVFLSRFDPVQPSNRYLPAIFIYNANEDNAGTYAMSARILKRETTFALELYAQQLKDENLDDKLDDFAHQVERVLFQDPQLGGLVSDLSLGAEQVEEMKGTDVPVGMVRQVWAVTYALVAEQPSRPIGEATYEKGFVFWNLQPPPPDGSPEAEDVIDIPQT